MQYMLLIYQDESIEKQIPRDEMAAYMQSYLDYTEWLKDKGWMLAGDALLPTATATTVRIREGETLHTDGPFATTKEQLGGYYLVDVPDLDAALEAARRLPASKFGSVEVRPVMSPEDYGV